MKYTHSLVWIQIELIRRGNTHRVWYGYEGKQGGWSHFYWLHNIFICSTFTALNKWCLDWLWRHKRGRG